MLALSALVLASGPPLGVQEEKKNPRREAAARALRRLGALARERSMKCPWDFRAEAHDLEDDPGRIFVFVRSFAPRNPLRDLGSGTVSEEAPDELLASVGRA